MSFGLYRCCLSQFSLIFVIRIPRNANEFDAVCIAECAVKILAVFLDGILAGSGFFDNQFAATLLPNLLAVQFGGQHPLSGALMQVVNFLLGLCKGKAYLLFGEVNGVLIQCGNDRGHKTIGGGVASFQLGVDLPLDGLAVSLRVDVRLFEISERYVLGVQVFVQLAALVCIAAHAGYAVKYNSVACLHGVKQLVQFSAALIGCAGIYFSDDMCGWVHCQNVAHLSFNVLLRRGNAAVAIYLHSGITSKAR